MSPWRRGTWLGLWLVWTGMGTGGPRPAAATDSPSAEPEIALEVEPDGGCGAPFLSSGEWSIWSSAMPYYRTRDGGDLRMGFLARHLGGTSMGAGVDYWTRARRVGHWITLRLPLRTQGERQAAIGIRVVSRYDATITSVDMTQESTVRERWGGPRFVRLSLAHVRYRSIPGLDARQWPPNRLIRLRLDAWSDRGAMAPIPLANLAGELQVTAGLGGVRRASGYAQMQATILGWTPRFIAWARTGLSVGRSPSNMHFDLAGEGQVLGHPRWEMRGPDYMAFGMAINQPLHRALHAAVFATHALLPGSGAHVSEAGIGLGITHDVERPNPSWKLRLEWPIYSGPGSASGNSVTLRRLSLRLWLWPRRTGILAAPGNDYRNGCLP